MFRRRRFFQDNPIRGAGLADIARFRPDGQEMSDGDWQVGYAKSLAILLNGDAIPDPNPYGEQICNDSFVMPNNAHFEPLDFRLPDGRYAACGRRCWPPAPSPNGTQPRRARPSP